MKALLQRTGLVVLTIAVGTLAACSGQEPPETAPDSLCRRSPILLLSANDEANLAQSYIGRGANRCIRLEDAAEEIQASTSSLLHVAPRKDARFMARLEIKIGGAKDMILCQTDNLSITGMLIQTERRYELGTKIHFEFSIGEDPSC